MIIRFKYIAILIFISILIFIFYPKNKECLPIQNQKELKGSHGYRVWSGSSLRSFIHNGKKVCIPNGWQSIGAIESGDGWALFPDEKTGTIILSSAFNKETMNFVDSNYKINLIYPKNIDSKGDLILYKNIINNTFNNVGKIFNDRNNKIIDNHIVLITSGLGKTDYEEDSIYPDPNINVTFLILKPDSIRGEELFIHAVMHLYNRYRIDLSKYQNFQEPILDIDWQEMEASWSETVFRTSNKGRKERLDYIYNVHNAVKNNNFSLIQYPPFNDFYQFSKMNRRFALEKDSNLLDIQYSHYILGPIVMVATEGLLQKYNTGTNLKDILAKIHTREINNFFGELSRILPKEEIDNIYKWINGEELVPKYLLDIAINYYNNQ